MKIFCFRYNAEIEYNGTTSFFNFNKLTTPTPFQSLKATTQTDKGKSRNTVNFQINNILVTSQPKTIAEDVKFNAGLTINSLLKVPEIDQDQTRKQNLNSSVPTSQTLMTSRMPQFESFKISTFESTSDFYNQESENKKEYPNVVNIKNNFKKFPML